VKLGNGNEEYPDGDNVQAVEPWLPPTLMSGLEADALSTVLDVIDAGLSNRQRYSNDNAAKARAAWKVIQEHSPECNEARAS